MNIRSIPKRVNQSGFTLIELLVVIGVLAILLSITLIAINPTKHFQDTRDTARRSDVAAILDAIYEYQAGNAGSLPASLASVSTSSSAPSVIASSGTGYVNMCDVVPTYMADLPLDPTTGTRTGTTTCQAGQSFSTGFTVYKSATSGRFTVSAPSAEGSAISVTR